MSWVKWSQICKPKKEGGLGVKDLAVFNLALLTKWRWRILKGDGSALWQRVLEERYGNELQWFGVPIPPNAATKVSIWWRDLALLGDDACLGLNWFNEVCKKRMGNGATTKFWTDTWHGRDSLAVLFPSVLASIGNSDASVADMGVWNDSRWEWHWNVIGPEVFFADGNLDAVILTEFVEFLQGIQPSAVDDDRWVWMIDIPRGFSVKSCYSWMHTKLNLSDASIDALVLEACKSLWYNDIPSKVLIFCWRLLLKKLPTRDKLFQRGILNSPQAILCVFCKSVNESVDHLFCSCGVVREVWRRVGLWLNVQVPEGDDVVSVYKGIGLLVKGKGTKRIKAIFWAATVYQIWLTRNSVIFNGTEFSVGSIVNSILYVSWGWFIARRGRKSGLNFSDWFCSPLGCLATL